MPHAAATAVNTAPVKRSAPLAWMLALAYTLLIVYASLQPFAGWRSPSPEIRQFLFAPWPRYVTLQDLAINVAAYVPLGFLLARALHIRLAALSAVIVAGVLSISLSLTMETIQMFMPQRIASNVDLLANALGALFGAMAAPLASPARIPGRRLTAWRRQLFVSGTIADTALVLALMWLLTHPHPTAQLFGTGNLRSMLDLPVYFVHTPGRLISVEAVVAFLNFVGLGLMIAAQARDRTLSLAITAGLVALGIALKTLAGTALFGAGTPFAWLTPGVTLGLAAGALVLYGFVHMPRANCLVVALACFCSAVAVINLAPDNPYQSLPPQLLAGSGTHLLRFSNIVRGLSELWPFLAIAHLVAALAAARGGHAQAAPGHPL